MVFLLLGACGNNHGSKLESDELDIYYVHSADEELARNIGMFWKENDLLGKKKQFIRVNRSGVWLEVQIIHSKGFDRQKVGFEEQKTLLDLQDQLRQAFPQENIRLVISDNQFHPVWDVNN